MKKLKTILSKVANVLFIVAVSTFILFTSTIAYSQWLPGGTVSSLGSWPSIFVLDQSTIFIVGGSSQPVIWRSTNAGLNYTQLPTTGISGTGRFFTCVWATSVNTIYAGDGATSGNGLIDNAKVYKTTNGGTNWTTILSSGSGVNGFINGVVFSRTNPLLGVVNCDPNSNSESFKMWKTTNGGTNWTLYTPSAPNSAGAQNSVFLIDGNFYGFGLNTASARVAVTTNGGTTFNYYALSGAGGANGFVSTVAFNDNKINGLCGTDQTSTTIPRTTNGGLNWFAQTIPCTITGMSSIKWVPGTASVYLVVSNSSASQCFKSEDNGATWVSFSFPSGTVSITHSNLVWNNVFDGPNANPAYVFAISSAGNTYQLQDSPMPVKLQSFTYNVNGRNVELKWSTSEEVNNYGFEIYRIKDGLNQDNINNWQKAGFINGNGTKNTPTNYNFSDLNLTTGKYVYRLKQIDYNGNYEYFLLSGKADIGSPLKYNLAQNYPNPFNPVTKIDYTLPYNSKVTLKVYDLSGREIVNLVNTNQSSGYYSVNFDASKLSSGAYFYKLIASSEGKDNIVLTKLMNVIK